MKTAFGIFLHDLKALARNPFALAVAIAIIALPSIYAWCSAAALWNPGSHADGLKVAVANKDAGVSIGDVKVDGIDADALSDKLDGATELNIGSLMIEAMGQDHSFDWQFVDAEQGESGLASGEYYAEFVLPEDFTKDFLSVLSGDLKRPTIEYWANEKYNAAAIGTADAGAGVVDSAINRVFSSLVADAMSGIVQEVASDILAKGGAATSVVRTGLDGASGDVKSVSDSLPHADESLDQWRDAVSSAKGSLDKLQSSVPDLQAAIDDGEKLLADARTASHEVNGAYSSALAQGGKEFATALDKAVDGVKKAAADIAEKQKDADAALEKAEQALRESERLIKALKKIDPDSAELADLEKENDKLQEEVANLGKLGAAVNDAAANASKTTEDFSQDVEKTIEGMKDRDDTFNSETLPKLDMSLDSVALVMGLLDGSLSSLDAQVEQAETLLDQLDGVLQKTKAALETTAGSLDDASDSIRSARLDLAAMANSESVRKASSSANIGAKGDDGFMSSPVSVEVSQVYPLGSYGAGVVPFYTNLAIWVGCLMLIMVVKLEVDPERFPMARPWQAYIGRLMLLGFVALLQGLVVTVGDLALGVQAVGPVSLVVAGLFAAFCFVNIVYALAITFKHVGKALAVIFLIAQIPAASGICPIQLMPGFFQALNPWLPFTYGMGAMREAIGGFYGATYVQCLAWLLACGLAALALALLVRPRLLNLNRLFDRKLEDADLFITAGRGLGSAAADGHPVADSLLETSIGRARLAERAERFAQRYAVMQQALPVAVVVIIVCFGVVSALLNLDANDKLVALMAFIVVIAVIFCLCIAFEFAHDNLSAQLGFVEDLAGTGDQVQFVDVSWEYDAGGESDTGGEDDAGSGGDAGDEGDEGDASSSPAAPDAEEDADE